MEITDHCQIFNVRFNPEIIIFIFLCPLDFFLFKCSLNSCLLRDGVTQFRRIVIRAYCQIGAGRRSNSKEKGANVNTFQKGPNERHQQVLGDWEHWHYILSDTQPVNESVQKCTSYLLISEMKRSLQTSDPKSMQCIKTCLKIG